MAGMVARKHSARRVIGRLGPFKNLPPFDPTTEVIVVVLLADAWSPVRRRLSLQKLHDVNLRSNSSTACTYDVR